MYSTKVIFVFNIYKIFNLTILVNDFFIVRFFSKEMIVIFFERAMSTENEHE